MGVLEDSIQYSMDSDNPLKDKAFDELAALRRDAARWRMAESMVHPYGPKVRNYGTGEDVYVYMLQTTGYARSFAECIDREIEKEQNDLPTIDPEDYM